MIKFLKNIVTFPFKKVAINASKTHLSPQANRKRIAQDILFLVIIVFTVFLVRFSWITVTDSSNGVKLSPLAKANYSETSTIYAKRGTIFDRQGVPIATDSSDYSVYVILDKNYVSADGKKLYASSNDFDAIASIFKDQLGIDPKYTKDQLTTPKLSQVEFGTKGKHISFAKKEAIEKAIKDKNIEGIGFLSHLARSYSGNFASNFIGLAGLKDGDDDTKGLIGQFGIEASLDGVLSGQNGVETLEKNKNGQTLQGIAKSIKPAKDGQDVYTTLDSKLQTYLETLMDEAMQKSGAPELVGTLVKADTGEILATTQRPTFNPSTQTVIGPKNDKVSDKQNLNQQSNLLYQAMYEPGSTFKLFTMSAAIENGTFDPNATYSSAPIVVGGATDAPISDWDVSTHPNGLILTYPQGFSHSSNVGMSKLKMAMGDKTWDEYLNRFKFGKPTLMGLGGEAIGKLPDDNIVSQVNSAFGQGISVTETQMLRGFSAVANGGKMLEPQFISKIASVDSQRIAKPEIIGQPISKKTADSVLKYMVSVGTDNVNGTAYDWNNSQPYFRVGDKEISVKTGTAQVANPTGGYYEGTTVYLYSAVAMVPSVNPDFIFYMTVKLPQHWSLSFISDVANPLLERAYELKSEIDASQEQPTNELKIAMKDYSGKPVNSTVNLLRQEILQPVVIGSGTVIKDQAISAGTKLGANKRVLLYTGGKAVMPDMHDWSKEDVETFVKWTGVTISYKGSEKGQVTDQNIKMNQELKKGQKLTVTLK